MILGANDWIPLAEVARPHGVRGELRLKLYNKDSNVLLESEEVLVRLASGEEHEVSVDQARRADQTILLKLYTVDDRDRADELRGAVLCVKRGALPDLAEGEFYAFEVEGARVEFEGQVLGKVRELRTYPSVEALAIAMDDGGADLEVPLVEAYVARVDVAGGVVTLATMEGLER